MGTTTLRRPGLVIGGEVVPGTEGTYPVYNPARPDEVVLEAPIAGAQQLEEALGAARQAQPAWAAMDPQQRAEIVGQASAEVAGAVDHDDLARLLTQEHGKVLWEATLDTASLGAMCGAFAPLARQALEVRHIAQGPPSTQVVPAPLGVVVALLPFNWPVAVLGNKLIPALLTGNTVVVKPPPTCPGAVLAAVGAMSRCLPPGVVGVVNGPDAALGSALVSHPGVDMVSFTGGVPTGRAVMAGAAEGIRPVVLELGGNDPAIVAPDVQVDEELADAMISGAFVTSGQVCMAIKRLYVHRSALSDMVDALVHRLSKEVVGDGLEPEVTMGPLHQRRAAQRVEAMVEEAAQGGAAVHRPAAVAPSGRHGGHFVSPALVVAPDPTSRIVVEEQFAPALPVLPYDHLEDALRAANDTPYGLCASFWSNDADLGATVAGRLEAGTVFINTHGMSAMDHRAPFGGWKQSGTGLELGIEGMAAFTRPRTVLTHPPTGTPRS